MRDIRSKDTPVYSRDGKQKGITTGANAPCQMESCRGSRITVKWVQGNQSHITRPCSSGLITVNGQWRIR